MPGFLGALGMQTATNAVNAGMGLALERHNDRRQLRQEARLQGQQMSNEREMINYNMDKQLQMWKDTNYPAQMEQLKLAGLNPALIYGMSGGGGVTAGQAQGHVEGGSAPKGGQEVIQSTGMGIQTALAAAQARNLDADTELKKVEAKKRAGVDTGVGEATIQNLQQLVQTEKAKQKMIEVETSLKEIEKNFANESYQNRLTKINYEASKLNTEISILETQKEITKATKDTVIAQATMNLIESAVTIELKQAQTGLVEADIQKVAAEISKWATELKQRDTQLNIEQQNVNVRAFEAGIKAKYPQVGAVIGRILNETANGIGGIIGNKPDTEKDPKK